jgi:hypothetical protein
VLWTEKYHEASGIAGLNFISLGIGYCFGIQVSKLPNIHIKSTGPSNA